PRRGSPQQHRAQGQRGAEAESRFETEDRAKGEGRAEGHAKVGERVKSEGRGRRRSLQYQERLEASGGRPLHAAWINSIPTGPESRAHHYETETFKHGTGPFKRAPRADKSSPCLRDCGGSFVRCCGFD